MADDRAKHVYLSDGGHFENLGIYELVRRRCSVIIACDAEEDHAFSFDGLGGVIRKCFVDFGVRIDIDVRHIRPKPGEIYSSQHWTMGLIHYPEGATGTLGFPHQSTTDQFFIESQVESYHRLGLNIAKLFKDRTLGLDPASIVEDCAWRKITMRADEPSETKAAAASSGS